MAREKARSSFACLVHVVMYTLPFLLLTQEPVTLAIIAGTHFAIDRWRLPKYLIWAKNLPFPGRHPFSECKRTGFPPEMPDHLATLLYIIIDATCHILINGAAIYTFG
jgi:hypothetical protein